MDRRDGRVRAASDNVNVASVCQIAGLVAVGGGLVLAPWWAVLLIVGFGLVVAGAFYEFLKGR